MFISFSGKNLFRLSWKKVDKELCALWQVLFSFARCPASGQLGIVEQIKSLASKKQCLKQSLQRLQLTSHTTDLTTMCAQNPASYKLLLNFISTVSTYLWNQWLLTKEVKRTIQGVLQRIGKIWQMSDTQLQAGAGYVWGIGKLCAA